MEIHFNSEIERTRSDLMSLFFNGQPSKIQFQRSRILCRTKRAGSAAVSANATYLLPWERRRLGGSLSKKG
jgi:hypothetical protein